MERTSGPIEAVFLDAGGVINLPSPAAAGRFLAAHGADGTPAAIERFHYHAMLAYDEAPGDEPALSLAYLAGFVTAAGLPGDLAADFRAAITEAGWQPAIQPSLDALPALAARVRLAIVSNSDGTVERRLADARVLQVGPGPGVSVVAVVDSAAVGIEKPDPRIFDFALAACGLGPGSVVHVGDSRRTDVAGALAAGIRPLHLDPFDLCPDRSHEHLRTLGEVLEMLGEQPIVS
ncbi:MAG TPA: HAD family hydrolase [Candidatus Dormibacteraeota bacterium]|nr:HAD family hydrolase [Candidatus Dormibacteraeota bacterium]